MGTLHRFANRLALKFHDELVTLTPTRCAEPLEQPVHRTYPLLRYLVLKVLKLAPQPPDRRIRVLAAILPHVAGIT